MLRFEEYRQHVAELYAAALAAVDPYTAVRRYLRREGGHLHVDDVTYDLHQGQVSVIAAGKAAIPMAAAAADVLGDALSAAVVISKGDAGHTAPPALREHPGVHLRTGSHPVSGPDSVSATAVAMELARQAGGDDLVLCLISGGASALLTHPRISLEDWQTLTGALLASGCTINELNAVRRQLDRVKGGGLARMAAPARCLSLILSDVVGNPLEAIGSGPTVESDESAADALGILARFDIADRLPETVYGRVVDVLEEEAGHTALPMPPANAVSIVGDVRAAALAALSKAMQLGFVAQLLTAHLEGEAREVGRVAAAIAKDTPPGRCLIFGGETTVTVSGAGRGGRNLEVALSAALALEGRPRVALASLATDGEDGPTPAAGAVICGQTAVIARAHDLPPEPFLDNNDSYTFFRRLDAVVDAFLNEEYSPALFLEGSTGTNVNDLLFVLTYPDATANGLDVPAGDFPDQHEEYS